MKLLQKLELDPEVVPMCFLMPLAKEYAVINYVPML